MHAWASMDGTYQSLTRYHIEEVDAKELPLGPPTDAAGTKSRPDEKISVLTGTIDVPISVGTVGGALQTHPTYKFSHDLLGRPDAKTLAQVVIPLSSLYTSCTDSILIVSFCMSCRSSVAWD